MIAFSRCFSFVDRITDVHNDGHVRGRYVIHSGLRDFPLSLAGEAVGQLAAWAAMGAVDFRRRPVAGLAGSIELLEQPRAGQVLELIARIEHVDDESVEYHGTAQVDGAAVIRLRDCVGPMVELAEFDDPRKLQLRFDELRQTGAAAAVLPSVPQLLLERTGGDTGSCAAATLRVPTEMPLFADHFPRRPVFPASLLMHMNLQLGAILAGEIPPPAKGRWVPRTILDMKLRSFIPPGATLRLEARLKQRSHDSARLALEARSAGEVTATAGLVLKAQDGV